MRMRTYFLRVGEKEAWVREWIELKGGSDRFWWCLFVPGTEDLFNSEQRTENREKESVNDWRRRRLFDFLANANLALQSESALHRV